MNSQVIDSTPTATKRRAKQAGKQLVGKRGIAIILVSALVLAALMVGLAGCTVEKKPKYAVIAAMDSEVELICNELKGMRKTELVGTPTYEGTIGNCDVIVMRCGTGKVSAGIGTQALIDTYHPDYVINTGCAGALSSSLGIGDVVISESVVEWDLDAQVFGSPLGYIDALECVEIKASESLCDQIASTVPSSKKVTRGLIVSGDQFISTSEQRKHILDSFPNALCAEMEGAAVGHTCAQNDVPFCVIRVMSDNANGDSVVDFTTFSEEAGRNSAASLVSMFKNMKG